LFKFVTIGQVKVGQEIAHIKRNSFFEGCQAVRARTDRRVRMVLPVTDQLLESIQVNPALLVLFPSKMILLYFQPTIKTGFVQDPNGAP
jgi:hypothetical protein